MSSYKYILLSLATLMCLTASAQRKRQKPSQPTPEELAAEALNERFNARLHSCEQVTFVDSIVVSLQDLFNYKTASDESGSITTCAKYFNQPDTTGATVYISQMRNKIIFSKPTDKGLRLFESEKIGQKWSTPEQLQGLDDFPQNYPFMLNDGVTLYYSAQDTTGLGQWDIYMARYDTDTKRYLAPENIGLPFNSKSNDYLYIIDEYHNLGWLATDRNQPQGKVCVYTFIPNTTRTIYNYEQLGHERTVSLANINSISDTWTDRQAVESALQRLKSIIKPDKTDTTRLFTLVINDSRTYHTFADFRNHQAAEIARQWYRNTNTLDHITTQLSTLRDKYHQSKTEQLSTQILQLEQSQSDLRDSIQHQVKEIRRLELQ